MIPPKEEFPYTIRLVSEILESNGSSSMASVCGGTLSLLNAGVPIKKSVAGIAMGLVTDGDRHVVLSDILGEEDHLGDMDFKVAGTESGITAFQMDIKVAGVDRSVLQQALEKAKAGRLKILEIMAATIDTPRSEISDHAPKIMSTSIPEDKIGALIGPGGANIRSITEQSGADVNIRDDGTVLIYARRKQGADKALQLIEARGRGARGRQGLRRGREAHHGLWRVRRVPPREGRPAAHLQDLARACRLGVGRAGDRARM